MTDIDLTAAIVHGTRAISEWQFIPDAGDGYPAIRGGSAEELATLAIRAALPEIRRKMAEQIEALSAKVITFGGEGHEIALLKAASLSRAKTLGEVAALVRGDNPGGSHAGT